MAGKFWFASPPFTATVSCQRASSLPSETSRWNARPGQIATLSSIYYKPPEAFVLKMAPISRADPDLDDEDVEVRSSMLVQTGAAGGIAKELLERCQGVDGRGTGGDRGSNAEDPGVVVTYVSQCSYPRLCCWVCMFGAERASQEHVAGWAVVESARSGKQFRGRKFKRNCFPSGPRESIPFFSSYFFTTSCHVPSRVHPGCQEPEQKLRVGS